MIVRIDQIDLARLASGGGWPAGGHVADFPCGWPAGTRAFEMVIRSQDEVGRPMTDAFRQDQFRQLILQVAIALRPEGEQVVLRLDGPVTDRELLPAWAHLSGPDCRGRFGFSAAVRDGEADAEAGVRLAPSWACLAAVFDDDDLGLERDVRARLLSVRPQDVPALLAADGDAVGPLLEDVSFMVGTTRELRSLHIVTRRLEAAEVKQKIMARLVALARGEPAVPP